MGVRDWGLGGEGLGDEWSTETGLRTPFSSMTAWQTWWVEPSLPIELISLNSTLSVAHLIRIRIYFVEPVAACIQFRTNFVGLLFRDRIGRHDQQGEG